MNASYLYHGSQVPGLKELKPHKHKAIDNEKGVFATPDIRFALAMAARQATIKDIAVGYHGDKFYVDELKDGAFKAYKQPASLYHLAQKGFNNDKRLMPEEVMAKNKVPVIKEEIIADLLEALKKHKVDMIEYDKVPEAMKLRGMKPGGKPKYTNKSMNNPIFKKASWHIVYPDGRHVKKHELWPRPKDAAPDNGDPYTPWYNKIEHEHIREEPDNDNGNDHPWKGSIHIKAKNLATALDRAKNYKPGRLKEAMNKEAILRGFMKRAQEKLADITDDKNTYTVLQPKRTNNLRKAEKNLDKAHDEHDKANIIKKLFITRAKLNKAKDEYDEAHYNGIFK